LYRRFFPEASEVEARAFVEGARAAETMAEFQGLLLGLESGTNPGIYEQAVRSTSTEREEIAVE